MLPSGVVQFDFRDLDKQPGAMGWAGKDGEKDREGTQEREQSILPKSELMENLKCSHLRKYFLLRVYGRNEVRMCKSFLRQDVSLPLNRSASKPLFGGFRGGCFSSNTLCPSKSSIFRAILASLWTRVILRTFQISLKPGFVCSHTQSWTCPGVERKNCWTGTKKICTF